MPLSIHIFCGFAFTYGCEPLHYRLVGLFTSLSRLTAVGNARAEGEDPFLALATLSGSKQVQWTGKEDQQISLVAQPWTKRALKNAAAQSHSVQRDENYLSVNSEAVSEMKWLSIPPGNRYNEELLLLISLFFSPYEPTLNSSSGSNRQQNDNALCWFLLLLYLTRASVRFHENLEIIKRATARGVTVSTYVSIIEFDSHNSRYDSPLGTDTATSAVALQVSSTTSGSGFNSNWSSAPCFSSPSAEISPKNSGVCPI